MNRPSAGETMEPCGPASEMGFDAMWFVEPHVG
jgi:hypothetical protein